MKHRILLIIIFAVGCFNVRAQWTALSGPPGANVQDIEYSTFYSKVYVVVNQRLYVSSNDGASWSQLIPTTPSNFYVNDLMVDGANLYALNYSQVFKSTDGGANWIRVNADGQYVYGYHIIKVTTNTLAVYGYSGMFVSKDDGVNWVQLSTDGVNSAVATSSGDLYYGDIKGIRKHANPGVNPWAGTNLTLSYNATAINTVWQYAYQYIFLGYDAISNNLYASVYNDVVKSVNSGATWTSIRGTTLTDATFQTYWGPIIMVGPTGNVFLYNYSSGHVFLTTNQGTSWATMTNFPSAAYSNQPIQSIAFASGTKAFAGTIGDGIFLSNNVNSIVSGAGTATWTFATNGLNAGSGSAMKVGASRLTYANGGKLWSSTDAGVTWVYNTPAITGSITHILKMPNGTFVAANNNVSNSLYVSTAASSGAAWTTVTTLPGSVSNDQYGIITDASNNLYASGYNVIYKTTAYSGAAAPTWTSITMTGLPASFSIYRLALDATNFYGYGYNGATSAYEIYKVALAGGAVTKLTLPTSYIGNQSNNGFFVSATGKLYVAQYNAIYISGDAGVTWSTVNFSNTSVFPIAGGVCGSTQGALYITKDDGLNWVSTSLPSSDGYITDIDTDGTNFFASGNNMPALKFTGNPVPVSSPVYINFSWQPTTGGPFGGYINQLQSDNSDNFYALSGGQIYKAPLSLSSWQNTNFGYSGGDYAYSMYYDKTGNKLYGNDYSQLYTSVNGGTTWTQVNSSENIYYRQAVKLSPNGDLVIIGQNPSTNVTGLYVSSDGGVTFGAAKYALGAKEYIASYPVEVSITSNNVIYFNTADSLNHAKLMKSANHGTTWTQVTLPAGETYVDYLSTDNLGNTFITTGNNLYKSADAGVTWVSVKGDFAISSGQAGKINARSATLYYMIATTNSPSFGSIVYKSTNGGTNWTPLATIDYVQAAAISSSNSTLVVGTNNNSNGILASTDGGATFAFKNNGLTAINFNQLELLSQSKLYLLGNGSNYSSVNGGTTWPNDLKNSNNFNQMFTLANGTFIAYNGNVIYSSADAGATWTRISTPNFGISLLTSYDGTFYFAVSYNNDVYFTSDLTTWTKISVSGLPASWGVSQIAADPSGILYIDLYNSSSGGNYEIYQVQFGTASKLNNIKSPYSVQYYQGKIYIYDTTGAIFSSSDGSVFTRQSTPTGDKLIIASKNYYFIPSYQGALWLSRDQGTTWQNVGISGYNGDFRDVVVNEFDGYAYGILPNSAVRKSANIVIPNDLTGPLATAFSPVNNAPSAGVGSIAITFDEAVKPTSGKFLKILDVASPISPVLTLDATTGVQNGKTFTYTLSPALAFGKTYFVVVDNDAFEDIFGNKFAGFTNNTTWKFTTRAQPTLVTLSPALNATGVALNGSLTATFSEGLTTGTGNFKLYKSTQPTVPIVSFATTQGAADYVTLNPVGANPQEQVVVTFDATYGDQRLLGATSVYLHAGVVTDTIIGTNWTYVVGNWGQDDGVGKMTAVPGHPNKWQITLSPTLRQYFNVPSTKTIYRLAMVFRNANGSIAAKPPATIAGAFIATNGDIFINMNQGSCVNVVLANGNSTSFALCAPLEFNTQYFVKVDPADFITSDGAALSFFTANTDWQFTTRAAPTITTFSPANGSTGAAINTTLAITTSETVTPTPGKKLYVAKSTVPGTPVDTVLLSSGAVSGKTFTYTLHHPLLHKLQYLVKMDSSSFTTTDAGLTQLDLTNTDWNFTTIDFPDTIPPVIATFTPPTFTKGASTNLIAVSVTDLPASTGAVDSVKISYRKTMATTGFITPPLNQNMKYNPTTSKWEIAVQDGWLDALGLEYSFQAWDHAKNTVVSPSAANTYYTSNISLTASNSPTISNLPTDGGASAYRIFSIPYTLADPKISTLFGLGAVDKTKIRILTFASGTTSDNATWSEYDKLQNITRGVGYWINTTKSASYTIPGTTTPNDTKANEFSMTIKQGWNQIGNPYPFEISWNAVQTASGNTSIGKVHTFSGSFTTGDKLGSGAGGFVFNGGGTATIKIPFSSATGGRQGEPADPFATDGWLMPITLEQGDVKNTLGGVGMHPGASMSYDGYDDLPLPQLFNSVEMKFDHPEFFAKTFNRDIVPVQSEFVWDFTIESSLKGQATMTWSNPAHADKDIYLFDVALQKPVNMLQVNHYSFNPRESNRFRVYYGETVIKPDYLFLGKAYPNPTSSSTTIPFSLPENNGTYKVRVDVYDMMGKKVATLTEGEFKPGFYTSEWNSSISNVPEGMYIYQMVVSDAIRNDLKTGKVVLKK